MKAVEHYLNTLHVSLRLDLLETRLGTKYDPGQPRVPAGNGRESGRWSKDEFRLWLTQGAGDGHHYPARATWPENLSPEARQVFQRSTTGPLIERHIWSSEHVRYNRAVREELTRFMRENGIKPESMSAQQAREFNQRILASREPAIRDFNRDIWRRQLLNVLRRRFPSRGNE
jgi:hypothetical protein